jgi:uncharacterized membrane protein (DUF2068 family)
MVAAKDSGGTETRVNDVKMHKAPHRWPLVLISLDKFVKAAGLVFVSFFLTPRWQETVHSWVNNAQITPHNWLVKNALHSFKEALGSPLHSLPLVRIGVIIYACLYLIEGTGLLFEKKWAEWMVVIGTAIFLPLEIYDFFRHPRVIMVILFLLNLLMAIYLLWRLRRQTVIKRERAALANATSRQQ